MVNNNDDIVTDEVESRLKDLFGDGDESPSFEGNSGESGKAPVKELEELTAVSDDIDKKDKLTPGESGDSPEFTEDKDDHDDSALRYLKAIVLSIDWEINDETMKGLIDETDRLKDVYEDDRTFVLLFQLLGSVGKYIKTNKAGAHPDSITLLNSIYASLEKVVLSESMTEAARKKELFGQLKKFKQLKDKIGLTKEGAAKKREVKSHGIPVAQTGERSKGAGFQKESRPGGETVQEVVRSDMSRMLPHEAFAFALEEIKEVIKVEFKAVRAELKLWRDGE
ncbi:MAG: hypothetical protein K8R45_09855 [Desulfobacterales bacterium]|nr:hypothetical protein [Desulfobacterales bacterium]